MKLSLLASSVDPDKVSLTVRGALTALIPLILLAVKALGYEVAESVVVEWVTALTAFVSAVMVLWGLIRKLKSQV